MAIVKTYDTASHDLAESFLQDTPHLWTKDRTHRLALEIQQVIEDFIAEEERNYEPPDPPGFEGRICGEPLMSKPAFNTSELAHQANCGWRPIETLRPEHCGTDVVLWNPCDGVHLLRSTISVRAMEACINSGIYSHWRKLDWPGPALNPTTGRRSGMSDAPDNLERCQDHPNANVLRIFDQTVYTLNQVETHTLSERTVGYECAVCGRALALLPSQRGGQS